MNSGITNCSYYTQGEQGGEDICNVEIQTFFIWNKKSKSNFFFFCVWYSPKKSTFPRRVMVSLRVTIICKRNLFV